MLVAKGVRFNWRYSSITAPATTVGTSVTPGASNAEGSWVQVASGASLVNDVYQIVLAISAGNTSAAQKDHLVDIGVDPAGGTAYQPIISNIVCGQSAAFNAGPHVFRFPFYIKAGSSVAVRVQGNNATAGTVRAWALFYGMPSSVGDVPVGQFSETIGTITNSGGLAFTPGNTAAEGAWVSLGTTTRDMWWWQLCAQCSAASTTAQVYFFDLAYGDATNKTMIMENVHAAVPGTAEITSMPNFIGLIEGYCEVPAGATIYVRGSASGTATAGWNAVAIGIGG